MECEGLSAIIFTVSTLVLNLDDHLARSLAAMAAKSHQPLPEWATEQLSRLAGEEAKPSSAGYTVEWMATFGSISDETFEAPERSFPRELESFDSN